jgi:hypothetical protein
MSPEIRGIRPRPRVALLGEVSDEVLREFKKLFPTLWAVNTFGSLSQMTHVNELDMVVISAGVNGKYIGNEINSFPSWVKMVHVINFCPDLPFLPGPIGSQSILLAEPTQT